MKCTTKVSCKPYAQNTNSLRTFPPRGAAFAFLLAWLPRDMCAVRSSAGAATCVRRLVDGVPLGGTASSFAWAMNGILASTTARSTMVFTFAVKFGAERAGTAGMSTLRLRMFPLVVLLTSFGRLRLRLVCLALLPWSFGGTALSVEDAAAPETLDDTGDW